MVSRNLSGIASEFEDMVEERDWQGFVALAGIGAAGGVFAEMFQDRVAPRLNQPMNPNSPRGLTGSFLIKGAAAVLLGMVAMRTGGDISLAVAALGVGAAVDAGVDLIDALDSLRNGSTSAAPRRRTSSRRSSQPRQVRPARSTSTSGGRASANLDQRGTAHPESLLSQV